MIPKSRRVQRALSLAVELRSIGTPWEEIATTINRRLPTVKRWQRRYAEYWQRLQREADIDQSEETAKETVHILRRLFRANATSDWIKSANLLIRLLIERQKIDLRAMQAGLLRPNPSESDSPNPKEASDGRPSTNPVQPTADQLHQLATLLAQLVALKDDAPPAAGADPASTAGPE